MSMNANGKKVSKEKSIYQSLKDMLGTDSKYTILCTSIARSN